MSSVCDVCAKKPIFGMSLSHSHRRTKRRWNPEHPAGPGDRRRHAQARERVHVVPEGGQDRQGLGRLQVRRFTDHWSRHARHREDVRPRHQRGHRGARRRPLRARARARRAQRLAVPACCARVNGSSSTSTPPAAPPTCAPGPRSTSASPPPRSRPPRSSPSAGRGAARAPAGHEADEREQHHRADERDEHRAQPEVADALVAGGVEQHAADQAADDTDDDRAEAARGSSRRR